MGSPMTAFLPLHCVSSLRESPFDSIFKTCTDVCAPLLTSAVAAITLVLGFAEAFSQGSLLALCPPYSLSATQRSAASFQPKSFASLFKSCNGSHLSLS